MHVMMVTTNASVSIFFSSHVYRNLAISYYGFQHNMIMDALVTVENTRTKQKL
jgi:hypothetical protein